MEPTAAPSSGEEFRHAVGYRVELGVAHRDRNRSRSTSALVGISIGSRNRSRTVAYDVGDWRLTVSSGNGGTPTPAATSVSSHE